MSWVDRGQVDGNVIYVDPEDFTDRPFTSLPESHQLLPQWVRPTMLFSRLDDSIWVDVYEDLNADWWWRKHEPKAYGQAIVDTVMRLARKGAPLEDPTYKTLDQWRSRIHWSLIIPAVTPERVALSYAFDAVDIVDSGANRMLGADESALVVATDVVEDRLAQSIARRLGWWGYHCYGRSFVYSPPDEDVRGEMKEALYASRFMIIANTKEARHTLNLQYSEKLAARTAAVIEPRGGGALFQIDEAYYDSDRWCRFAYAPRRAESAITDAVTWATRQTEALSSTYDLEELRWIRRFKDNRYA